MNLSPAERETVISWTDADGGSARVYTCQGPMLRKLAKHPAARLVETYRASDGTVTGVEYELPVSCVTLRSGRKRSMSPAQREASRRSLEKARGGRYDAHFAPKTPVGGAISRGGGPGVDA